MLFRIFTGIQAHIPGLCSISPEPSGEGDIEHKPGIRTRITCEDSE